MKKTVLILFLQIALLMSSPTALAEDTTKANSVEQLANEISDYVCGCSQGLKRLGADMGSALASWWYGI